MKYILRILVLQYEKHINVRQLLAKTSLDIFGIFSFKKENSISFTSFGPSLRNESFVPDISFKNSINNIVQKWAFNNIPCKFKNGHKRNFAKKKKKNSPQFLTIYS